MGFFNQIFSKNKKDTKEIVVGEADAIKDTIREADSEGKEEAKEAVYYTLMAEQLFSMKEGGAIVAGILRGAKAKESDKVYVLKRGKQVLESKILVIDNPKVGKMKEAPAGAPIAIALEGIKPEQIHMGDIITNEAPNTTDINQAVTNPRIKGLMRQAAGAPTEEIMNLIYEELAMNARFISAMILSEEPQINEQGMAEFKEGTTMQLPLLTAPAGSKYYPAFTDMEELQKWEDMMHAKTVLLSFDDYAAMALPDKETNGVVINPFSENMVVEKPLLEHLKQKKELLVSGMTTQKVSGQDAEHTADIAEFPVDMAKAITKVLEGEATVNQAWLRLMRQNQVYNYLLVVDLEDMEQRERVFEEIAKVVRPYLNGMLINIIVYQSDFGKKATEAVQPFYHKE